MAEALALGESVAASKVEGIPGSPSPQPSSGVSFSSSSLGSPSSWRSLGSPSSSHFKPPPSVNVLRARASWAKPASSPLDESDWGSSAASLGTSSELASFSPAAPSLVVTSSASPPLSTFSDEVWPRDESPASNFVLDLNTLELE